MPDRPPSPIFTRPAAEGPNRSHFTLNVLIGDFAAL